MFCEKEFFWETVIQIVHILCSRFWKFSTEFGYLEHDAIFWKPYLTFLIQKLGHKENTWKIWGSGLLRATSQLTLPNERATPTPKFKETNSVIYGKLSKSFQGIHPVGRWKTSWHLSLPNASSLETAFWPYKQVRMVIEPQKGTEYQMPYLNNRNISLLLSCSSRKAWLTKLN